MKFSTCFGLLLLLSATAALAQTHPPKKRSHKPAVVQKQWPTRMQDEEDAFIQHTYEELPLYDQPAPTDPNRVYTYVEQMPTLNGQKLLAASIQALKQLVVLPADAPAGRVFVMFELDTAGVVRHPQVVKGLRADLDSAVVQAARKLPRFTPGRQAGRAVRVSTVVPVTVPAAKQE